MAGIARGKSVFLHYINNLDGGGCVRSLELSGLNFSLLTGKITGKTRKISRWGRGFRRIIDVYQSIVEKRAQN